MRKLLFTVALATTLVGSAFADAWSHKGEDWKASNGFTVKVPVVLQPTPDKVSLTAKNKDAFSTFIIMEKSMSADAVMKKLDTDCANQFKNAKFSAPQKMLRNGVTVRLRQGNLSANGKTLIVSYGEFVKSKDKIAFITVVEKGDKVGVPLLDKMMGSVK